MTMENVKCVMENGGWTVEAYLAGEQPMQPELTALPSDDELSAAEAEFDRIMAEQQTERVMTATGDIATKRQPRKPALLRWWPVAAAAVLAVAFLLTPGSQEEDVATAENAVDIALPRIAEIEPAVAEVVPALPVVKEKRGRNRRTEKAQPSEVALPVEVMEAYAMVVEPTPDAYADIEAEMRDIEAEMRDIRSRGERFEAMVAELTRPY